MEPRRQLVIPARCSAWATIEIALRCTPIDCARNSWVSGNVSPPHRSRTRNNQRDRQKANSALDNATNHFTAQGRDNPSDIGNLLDGIGNGVQILQAANTGITSLQKPVDTAKRPTSRSRACSSCSAEPGCETNNRGGGGDPFRAGRSPDYGGLLAT